MSSETKLQLEVTPVKVSAVSLLEPLITFIEEYEGAVSYFMGDRIEQNLRNTALLGIEASSPAFEAPPQRTHDFDKALAALVQYLKQNNFVKEASADKMSNGSFSFKIEGCAFAKHIHGVSKPTGGTGAVCPLLLMAVKFLIEGNTTGMEFSDSKYSVDGTETEIRLVQKQKR